MVQSILEGRTDCPINGVLGRENPCGRCHDCWIIGDGPTLKVMVVTKKTAAAHAKHIESLQLPPSLEEKFGRLVGVTELEKGPASKTKLDVLPGFRNTVLRTKQVNHWLRWWLPPGMYAAIQSGSSVDVRCVDVALNDEGQLGRILCHCKGSPQRPCSLVWGSQTNARGTAREL